MQTDKGLGFTAKGEPTAYTRQTRSH